MQADIIYHLFDRFTEYQEELKRQKREEFKHQAVFPCKLRVLPNAVFMSRDPIVAGVIVEAGVVRQGTPLCVPSKEVRHQRHGNSSINDYFRFFSTFSSSRSASARPSRATTRTSRSLGRARRSASRSSPSRESRPRCSAGISTRKTCSSAR